MSDRELLELAAKAIGIQIECIEDEDGLGCARKTGGEPAWVAWNPLSDDGDALRLAVKLQIDIQQFLQYRGRVDCLVDRLGKGFGEKVSGDPYAATRRAITRAAAEIGARITTEDGK
ncbi:hypothetical protein [Burkholderia gladioli]|uniref:hypothetical protein n=1 Tax=Burkholderia gladioli TaxID=28095 RepID=UPI001903E7EB|nr:hypothetical protein [Burkholderia gladioli]MBJ9709836.1 hypothetical protein [Burkholderia gladioli]